MKDPIYIAIDVEVNGPIPGPFSMYSYGAVAANEEGETLAEFTDCLEELPGAGRSAGYTKFWTGHPEEFAVARKNPRDPEHSMREFQRWLTSHGGQPIAVAKPAGVDFSWIHWYLMRFAKKCAFGFESLDLRSVLTGQVGGYKNVRLPRLAQKHIALEDARETSDMLFKIIGRQVVAPVNPNIQAAANRVQEPQRLQRLLDRFAVEAPQGQVYER